MSDIDEREALSATDCCDNGVGCNADSRSDKADRAPLSPKVTNRTTRISALMPQRSSTFGRPTVVSLSGSAPKTAQERASDENSQCSAQCRWIVDRDIEGKANVMGTAGALGAHRDAVAIEREWA